MTQDQIMKLVDEYAAECSVTGFVSPSNRRAAVVAALEAIESEVEMWKATANAVVDFEKVELRRQVAALTKDAERWKMLAEMEASMVAGETMRFYIANPDKLDYVVELKHNAYGAAITAQKGEQV